MSEEVVPAMSSFLESLTRLSSAIGEARGTLETAISSLTELVELEEIASDLHCSIIIDESEMKALTPLYERAKSTLEMLELGMIDPGKLRMLLVPTVQQLTADQVVILARAIVKALWRPSNG